MTKRFNLIGILLAATLVAFLGRPAPAQHDHDHDHEHADMVVGKTGAGELAVEYEFDEVIGLPPVDGLLVGCAADDPGFMNLDEDEPAEDFFMLPPGANVVFELVSADPGIVMLSPGLIDVLEMPGEQFVIGTSPFDVHPTFLIDGNDPAFDANAVYTVTFRLLDSSGACLSSADYTASFSCAPVGACCLADGECEEGETEEGCEDEGGFYLGDDSSCGNDSDADGAVDACDNCPAVANGNQLDSDGDGSGNACDGCPNDANKVAPGVCGCGRPDDLGDSDGDGVADCNDVCPGVTDALFAPDCAGAIPTTSEWGLVVLGLLLIVAGKLFYGARPRVA